MSEPPFRDRPYAALKTFLSDACYMYECAVLLALSLWSLAALLFSACVLCHRGVVFLQTSWGKKVQETTSKITFWSTRLRALGCQNEIPEHPSVAFGEPFRSKSSRKKQKHRSIEKSVTKEYRTCFQNASKMERKSIPKIIEKYWETKNRKILQNMKHILLSAKTK